MNENAYGLLSLLLFELNLVQGGQLDPADNLGTEGARPNRSLQKVTQVLQYNLKSSCGRVSG